MASRRKRRNTSPSPNWTDLPDLALFSVAARLNLKDLLRFGSVCKTWQSFVKANRTDLTAHQPPLLLLLRTLKSAAVCDLYSASDQRVIYHTSLRGLRDCEIIALSHGYIIAVQHSSRRVLAVSPFTRDKHQFPSITSRLIFTAILTAPPSSPDCLLLAFEADSPVIMYCRSGDAAWATYRYGNGKRGQAIRNGAAVGGGKLYGLTMDHEVVTIELEPHPRVVGFAKPRIPVPGGTGEVLIRLVNAGGDLLVVGTHREGDVVCGSEDAATGKPGAEEGRCREWTEFADDFAVMAVRLDSHWQLAGLRELKECMCCFYRGRLTVRANSKPGVVSVALPGLPEDYVRDVHPLRWAWLHPKSQLASERVQATFGTTLGGEAA